MSFLSGLVGKIRNGFDDVGSFVTGNPAHGTPPQSTQPRPPIIQTPQQTPFSHPNILGMFNPANPANQQRPINSNPNTVAPVVPNPPVNPAVTTRNLFNKVQRNNPYTVSKPKYNPNQDPVYNSVVKPVINTFGAPLELGRSIAGLLTHNPQAELTAANRAKEDVGNNVITNTAKGAINFGKAAYYAPEAIAGEVQAGITGRPATNPAFANAPQKGLSALNQSYQGGALTAPEKFITSHIPGAAQSAQQAGFNPKEGIASTIIKTGLGLGQEAAPLNGLEYAIPKALDATSFVKQGVQATSPADAGINVSKPPVRLPQSKSVEVSPPKAQASLQQPQLPHISGTQVPLVENSSSKTIQPVRSNVNTDRPLTDYEQMVAAQEGLSDKEFLQKKSKTNNFEDGQIYNEGAFDKFLTGEEKPPTQQESLAKAITKTPDLSVFENDRKTPAQAAIEVVNRPKPGTYDDAVKAYLNHSPGVDLRTAQKETTLALEAAGKTPVGGTRGEYGKNETPFGIKQLEVNEHDAPTGKMKAEGTFPKIGSLEARANKIGEAGKEFTQRANNVHAEQSVIRQQMEDTAKPYFDLSKEDQKTAALVKEGKAKTRDPAIKAGVNALHKLFPDALQTARVHGLPVGDQGRSYFPHMYEKGLFDKPKEFNAAIDHLVKTGQAPNRVEAVKLMNQRKTGDYMGGKIFSNLEKQRELDLPGYRLDSGVVHEYNAKFAKRLAETKQFGANGEKIAEIIDRAAKSNQDANSLQEIINSYLNPKRSTDTLSKTLGAYQKGLSTLQLTKAAVSHIPQGFANVGTKVGFTKYFGAMRDQLFKSESKDFLHKAGFEAEKSDHKTTASNVITAPFLKQVREFHRDTAAIGGRNVALGMAERGDIAGLRKFGVAGELKPEADGKITLSFEQQVQAAHFLTDHTIFTDSPLQSPAWTQSSLGKFAGQYRKAYAFKQSEFIANLFSEAKTGNVAPLFRYLGVALPVSGVVVAAGKNLIKNPTQNPFPTNTKDAKKFAIDSLRNSGGLSVGMGVGDSALNLGGYHRTGDQTWQGIASAVAPGLGTAVQFGQNVAQGKNGSWKALEKQGLSMIPLVGSHISQARFPTKPITPDEQAYFNARDQATKDLGGAQDKRDLAQFNDYFSRNKTSDDKTIMLDQNQSAKQWGNLSANPKVLGEIQKVEVASSNHNPQWDLKGTGIVKTSDGRTVNVPKLVLYAAYKNLAPGDLQKIAIAQANPWIGDTENASALWSDKNIKTGNSVSAPGYVPYPAQSSDVQSKFNQMTTLSAIPNADRSQDQRNKLNAIFDDPDIISAMHEQQVYTDRVRQSMNLPPVQHPVQQTPEVSAAWADYDNLGTAKGVKSAWIKANPDLWGKMQQNSVDSNMYSIDKYGGEAYYGAKVPDSFLSAIYGVGNYDISKVKNANGTSTYSLLNFLNNSPNGATNASGLPIVNANQATGTTGAGPSYKHYSSGSSFAKRQARYRRKLRTPKTFKRFVSKKKPHKYFFSTSAGAKKGTIKLTSAKPKTIKLAS